MTLAAYRHLKDQPHVQPHGCWRIVARALSEVHGVDLPEAWGADLPADDLSARCAQIQERVANHGTRVEAPQPGDVAVMWRFGRPVHVALVVDHGWLLQSTSTWGYSHFVRADDVLYATITYHRP